MALMISTTSNYHWVKKITASSSGCDGALKITFHGAPDASDIQYNQAEVTVFTEDAAMVALLVEAINAVQTTPALPSYEEALHDPEKARVLFDASKGGNVKGITEDHRFALADVFQREVA